MNQRENADYDIAVIGGGINGAGIARDAALRGLRVLLLEKDDFGGGTTAKSSRLIHGGLRYLEYGELPLVFESLHERRRLRQAAPHLVSPLRLNIPVYEGGRRSKFIVRLGMIAYDFLSIGKRLPGHRMLSKEELLKEAPGLNQEKLLGGAQYYDAQVTFAERLVIENIVAARSAGADVRNYSPVIGINVRKGAVHGLQFLDHASGEEVEISARVIINAAGPWVDKVLATVNRDLPQVMGGTKGSHIIVGPFNGAPQSAFYVEAEKDGRPFFIIPWNGQFLIGTTDIRYLGDPADAKADSDEIDYLLAETNRVFPAARLSTQDILFTYAGVRPLPKRDKGPESAITRKHIIFKHRKQASGLISIIGGKLTTYRNLAELAVNVAVRKLNSTTKRCSTKSIPLPGGGNLDAAQTRLVNSGLSESCIERLLGIYGSRATDLIDSAGSEFPGPYLDEDRTVLRVEVAFVVDHEMAVTLIDVMHRRMMVGFRPDQGAALAAETVSAAAEAIGWDRAECDAQLGALQDYNARLKSAGV